jgi:hypothetical protein
MPEPACDLAQAATQLGRIEPGAAHHRMHDLIVQKLFEAGFASHLPNPHLRGLPHSPVDEEDDGEPWLFCGNCWLF